MATKPKTPDEILKNLVDLASEEVLSQSDEEILAEAAKEHSDVRAHVETLRVAVAARVAARRKRRLLDAREGLNKSRAATRVSVAGRKLPELKEMAQALFAQRHDIPERLTLAFRSGESISDDDWASLIDDLVELGFLSDEEQSE